MLQTYVQRSCVRLNLACKILKYWIKHARSYDRMSKWKFNFNFNATGYLNEEAKRSDRRREFLSMDGSCCKRSDWHSTNGGSLIGYYLIAWVGCILRRRACLPLRTHACTHEAADLMKGGGGALWWRRCSPRSALCSSTAGHVTVKWICVNGDLRVHVSATPRPAVPHTPWTSPRETRGTSARGRQRWGKKASRVNTLWTGDGNSRLSVFNCCGRKTLFFLRCRQRQFILYNVIYNI